MEEIKIYDIENNQNENYKKLCITILSASEKLEDSFEKYNETIFSSTKLQETIKTLDEIEQIVINERYSTNKTTIADLAYKLKLTTERIRFIERKALRKLRQQINIKNFYLDNIDINKYNLTIDELLNNKELFYKYLEINKSKISSKEQEIEKIATDYNNIKKETRFKNTQFKLEKINLNKEEIEYLKKIKITDFKSFMRISNIKILLQKLDNQTYENISKILNKILKNIEIELKYETDYSIAKLNLSSQKKQILRNIGIETIDQLTQMTRNELSLYMQDQEIVTRLGVLGYTLISEEKKEKQLKEKISKKELIRNIRITELNITRKTYRYLHEQQIKTLDQLLEYTENELNMCLFNQIMNECEIKEEKATIEKITSNIMYDIKSNLKRLNLNFKDEKDSPTIKYILEIIKKNPKNLSEIKTWQLNFKPLTYYQLKEYKIENLENLINLSNEDLKHICKINKGNMKIFSQHMYDEIINKIKFLNIELYNTKKAKENEKLYANELENITNEELVITDKYNKLLDKEQYLKKALKKIEKRIKNNLIIEKNIIDEIKKIEEELEKIKQEKIELITKHNYLTSRKETYNLLIKDDKDKMLK